VPINFPTPIGHSTSPASEGEISLWLGRLSDESARQRRNIRACVFVGILFYALVFAVALLSAELVARFGPHPRAESYLAFSSIAAVICFTMLIVAIFTKPEGRTENARRVFDAASSEGWDDSVEAKPAIALALIVALYGSYALVEAAKRFTLRLRLANTDRLHTARILAEVCANPAGIHWKKLLQPGQTLNDLRRPISTLLLDGWIQIADHGQTVVKRSPAMRRARYRHPLADVFELGPY
jgi:hypothetical protein